MTRMPNQKIDYLVSPLALAGGNILRSGVASGY